MLGIFFSLNRGKGAAKSIEATAQSPNEGKHEAHSQLAILSEIDAPSTYHEEEERQRKRWREKDFTLYVPGYSTSPSAKPNTSLRSTIYMLGRIIATILWYRSD